MPDRLRFLKNTWRTIIVFCLVHAGCLLCRAGFAQSPVTLTINATAPGNLIPPDFIGLSFETQSLQENSPGVKGRLFDPANAGLLMLFRNIGVKNLRIGGTSVDTNQAGYVPDPGDIDLLFHFARAANAEVIYSLRLLNGDPAQDADIAKYILNHYPDSLLCFAIGNEPNLYKNRAPEITNEPSWFAQWSRFAAAVTNAVPDAKIGGPDTGTGGAGWVPLFAASEAGSPSVDYIFAHYYVGGFPRSKAPGKLIDAMLSFSWDQVKYAAYDNLVGAPALSNGLPYRLTEFNNYVAGLPGVWGGNNAFATALFALDSMHWWAEHGCHGVNFHTVLGKYNGTIYCDTNGNYQVWPVACGIKAFDLGGHGRMTPVTISNPDHLNLTAYAVSSPGNELFVTIINKEHGPGARAAMVELASNGFSPAKAAAMFLTAPHGDVTATSGITLGGASLADDAPWHGVWTALVPTKKGVQTVVVPAASAAIVKMSAR